MPGLAIGHSHGGVRGAEQTPRSPLFEGRFGRMFRRLKPATFSEQALHALATLMIAETEAEPTLETEVDNEENQGIAAGNLKELRRAMEILFEKYAGAAVAILVSWKLALVTYIGAGIYFRHA